MNAGGQRQGGNDQRREHRLVLERAAVVLDAAVGENGSGKGAGGPIEASRGDERWPMLRPARLAGLSTGVCPASRDMAARAAEQRRSQRQTRQRQSCARQDIVAIQPGHASSYTA